MQKLTVCIPTYNRSASLKKNIDLLEEAVSALHARDRVNILISDNHSEDVEATQAYIKQYDNITLLARKENIGTENYRYVVDAAGTDWVMLMGDDDYIFIDYLKRILDYINDDTLSAIVGNFYPVDEAGRQTGHCRDSCKADRRYQKGDLTLMFKGHQLSGLVFRKNNGLIAAYDEYAQKNVYCEIYFLAYNLLRGDSIHITETPLRNTVIAKKNWDYSVDNLFGELLKNVYGLGLPEEGVDELLDGLLNGEFLGRVCHPKNCLRPGEVFRRIDGYRMSEQNKNKAKKIFMIRMLWHGLRLPNKAAQKALATLKAGLKRKLVH